MIGDPHPHRNAIRNLKLLQRKLHHKGLAVRKLHQWLDENPGLAYDLARPFVSARENLLLFPGMLDVLVEEIRYCRIKLGFYQGRPLHCYETIPEKTKPRLRYVNGFCRTVLVANKDRLLWFQDQFLHGKKPNAKQWLEYLTNSGVYPWELNRWRALRNEVDSYWVCEFLGEIKRLEREGE